MLARLWEYEIRAGAATAKIADRGPSFYPRSGHKPFSLTNLRRHEYDGNNCGGRPPEGIAVVLAARRIE
jgi:hypothetical protein